MKLINTSVYKKCNGPQVLFWKPIQISSIWICPFLKKKHFCYSLKILKKFLSEGNLSRRKTIICETAVSLKSDFVSNPKLAEELKFLLTVKLLLFIPRSSINASLPRNKILSVTYSRMQRKCMAKLRDRLFSVPICYYRIFIVAELQDNLLLLIKQIICAKKKKKLYHITSKTADP